MAADASTLPRPVALWARRLIYGALGAGLSALAMGVPTDVVPNNWFTRMTPVRPLDVILLVLTAVTLGVLAATYADRSVRGGGRRGLAGGGLAGLAIGCPICNKAVVWLIGVSGALNWFGPAQPVIGAAGLGLAVWAVVVRLRRPASCPLPS